MAGRKVKGRKRHIVVDTQGNLLYVRVHAANAHDTVAGCTVFNNILAKHMTLKGVCADAGYRGTFVDYVTDSWFNSFKCLSRDYEISKDSVESVAYIAHSMVLLRRLSKP